MNHDEQVIPAMMNKNANQNDEYQQRSSNCKWG